LCETENKKTPAGSAEWQWILEKQFDLPGTVEGFSGSAIMMALTTLTGTGRRESFREAEREGKSDANKR